MKGGFHDFASPEFFENPYPLYEKIRRAGAILPVGPNAVVAGQASLIEALLRNRPHGQNIHPERDCAVRRKRAVAAIVQGVEPHVSIA
ncbi:hypothetical protein F6X40_27125 [Paraburkholderia sp. UCT31]|uniref:hypothetical protein n=1 Tax=Paraburkholderia sp. UCT31 TaxID=2615209 RepID=UPI0016564144|nr:hypothetical protein [Paraburkholderia sp. UCT31]MBC8740343.1 hypothetical protein [Paraburkholderia sp. UCT31]